MLSTSTIEAVRALPIEQVIGDYVTLKPAGSALKACCPLHNEKTPSFVVRPAKNRFDCYGCGKGGDAIAFVMEHDSLPFIEAVISIAKQHNVTIEQTEQTGKTKEQIDDETIMHGLLEAAQKKYRDLLRSHLDTLRYLRVERNLSRSTIIEWQLGVCPEWKVISAEIIKGGHLEQAKKCGLVGESEGSVYDYFHQRITIPIHDLRGELIGFGGRILPGKDGAKYFNPPNSPLYDKSRTLFGLSQAIKPYKAKVVGASGNVSYVNTTGLKYHGMAMLVEGYFDVIKPHQRGWNNAVGTCGTALTEGQAKQLKRFTETVLILRDGDKAGFRAMEKDIPILVAQQFTVYLCVMPKRKVITGRKVEYATLKPLPELEKETVTVGKKKIEVIPLREPVPFSKREPEQFYKVTHEAKEVEEDPDSLFDQTFEYITGVLSKYQDGIEYLGVKYYNEGMNSPTEMAVAIEKAVKLLALITNDLRRAQYIKVFCKIFTVRANEFTKPLEKFYKDEIAAKAAELHVEDPADKLPVWVDKTFLYERGFVQLTDHTKGFKAGIYFMSEHGLNRVTNFTIKPLYHIFEQSNNRRLVEVNNATKSSVAELPNQATTNKSVFETELMSRGYYHCEYGFGPKQFKGLIGWLGSEMPIAYELKTLGWQPEGFFAFSNAVWHEGNLLQYDDLGMIRIEEKHYISMGNSKIHRDERQIDNPYENDLYLKFVKPKEEINFSGWAKLFFETYTDNAPYGIAHVFLTLFKDIVTRVAKMPMLYCYGPKGSGKSQMAESITWLFFSGMNAEHELIKGYNLNPGQGTPFSFFSRVERFRNCPILMNEFDENNVEDWKFGTFKAAYDGEGREVGDGDSGKKRKTKIQKVQGVIILVGQYLSVRDDGSVLSRSISCPFSLERISNITPEQQLSHDTLKVAEKAGLSALITELLQHRAEVQKRMAKEFSEVQGRLVKETRDDGHRIEARLISNYSLSITATKIVIDLGIKLPYEYEEFYTKAKAKVIEHNRMLKDNNSIQQFWKGVEFLFDTALVANGRDVLIKSEKSLTLKVGEQKIDKEFHDSTDVLYVRFSNLYAIYSKYHRERTGKAAPGEETLLMYMKEQTYYLGLCPSVSFSDKRTSCYAFNYTIMKDFGIMLDKQTEQQMKNLEEEEKRKNNPPPPEKPKAVQDDLPF